MASSGRLLAATLALAAVGCDIGANTRVHSAPWPVSARTCLDTALTRSALLERAEAVKLDAHDAREGRRHYVVFFKDSDLGGSGGSLWTESVADSAMRLTVSFDWLGRLAKYSPAERQRMIQLSAELLRELRSACAPDAPAELVCEQYQTIGRQPSCSVPVP